MIRIVTIILLVVGLGPRAHADPSLDAKGKAYFERGVALYKARRYVEARAEFSAGYELSRRPLFLFNMAECSRLNNEPALALDYYRRYLEADRNGSFADLARKRIAALGGTSPPEPAAEPPRQPPPPPAPDLKLRDTAPTATPPSTIVAPAPERSRPIYARPWFWGVGAAVVAGTVAVIVVARGRSSCSGCPVYDLTGGQ